MTTEIRWQTCPKWCERIPDPSVDYTAGGHLDDLRDDGTGTEVESRLHERSWKLPSSGRDDAVSAIEVQAFEYRTPTGTRLDSVHMVVAADAGEFLSLEAAAEAANAITQLLDEITADQNPCGTVKPLGHSHFGYWINKNRRTARCYDCGHQYIPKSDNDAEPWPTSATPHTTILGPAAHLRRSEPTPNGTTKTDRLRQLCKTPFDILEIEGDDGTITDTPVVRAIDVIAAIDGSAADSTEPGRQSV